MFLVLLWDQDNNFPYVMHDATSFSQWCNTLLWSYGHHLTKVSKCSYLFSRSQDNRFYFLRNVFKTTRSVVGVIGDHLTKSYSFFTFFTFLDGVISTIFFFFKFSLKAKKLILFFWILLMALEVLVVRCYVHLETS